MVIIAKGEPRIEDVRKPIIWLRAGSQETGSWEAAADSISFRRQRLD